MSNIKKNLWYQTLYQILNFGLPLITAPFLARVLGAEPLGIMSYTNSIVHYFTLFAMMGLTNYGTRSVAVVKENKKERDSVFSQILYMQLFTTGIALIAYGICMYFFLHIVINLMGVMGLGPLTGVPLPFLSYGGSYVLNLMWSLGLVQRVAIESNKKNKKQKEA